VRRCDGAKRRDSRYRWGRSLDWIKCKNPDASAVKREAEEDLATRPRHSTGKLVLLPK
jgi:ATP-dependent DNA ligase